MNAAPKDEQPLKRSIRYLRVSSKRQMDTDADVDPDGNSIDTQRKQTQEKERALGTINVGEYVEPGNSAQTIDKRPVFREMLERIKTEHDVDYVVIYMRSRAFRNHFDATVTKKQLEKLGVKLVSAKEDFGEGIMADAMEAVTDIFNEVQVRLSGQDIKMKLANKAKNGGTISKAKVGYLNARKLVDGHKVNTVIRDPERDHFIPMAFELFATGDHTIDTLREALTAAGFTTPPSGRWPGGVVSRHTLGQMLRDRYYLGEVLYEGIWYPGRHEPLVTAEVFDRVQRVLDSHSGAGTRSRTHKHYLKGLLWCGRCKSRLTVQRAVGRHGGEYFYWLCMGRQRGTCDLPYVPVEVLEEAVADYYRTEVLLPADAVARLRAQVDDALTDSFSLTATMRGDFEQRLATLERKESYFLDLAAEEDWPKDKLREKINNIRAERGTIRRNLEQTTHQLEAGRQVFHRALDLLTDPGELYTRSGEGVRAILNRALFTRLYADAKKITGNELKEPFDALHEAYKLYESRGRDNSEAAPATYHRRTKVASHAPRGQRDITNSAVSLVGHGTVSRVTLIDSLSLAFGGQGWSRPVMVRRQGLEPRTRGLRVRCSAN